MSNGFADIVQYITRAIDNKTLGNLGTAKDIAAAPDGQVTGVLRVRCHVYYLFFLKVFVK